MENEIVYIKAARWATLSGMFTPEELRQIADEIESNFKEFEEAQNGDTQ